jgi:hypothetical protein
MQILFEWVVNREFFEWVDHSLKDSVAPIVFVAVLGGVFVLRLLRVRNLEIRRLRFLEFRPKSMDLRVELY